MTRKRTTIIALSVVGLAWLLTLGVHVSYSVDIHRDSYPQRTTNPDEIYFSFNIEREEKTIGIPFLLTVSRHIEPFRFKIYADTQNMDVDKIIIDSVTLQSSSMRMPQKIIQSYVCLSEERKRYRSGSWVDYSAYWLETGPKIQFADSASVEIEYKIVFQNDTTENRSLKTEIRMKKEIDVDTYWSGVGAAIGGA